VRGDDACGAHQKQLTRKNRDTNLGRGVLFGHNPVRRKRMAVLARAEDVRLSHCCASVSAGGITDPQGPRVALAAGQTAVDTPKPK